MGLLLAGVRWSDLPKLPRPHRDDKHSVWQSPGDAFAGLLGGLVLTALARRLYAGMLYEISPSDPATLALVPVGLLLVALVAASGPARRAGKVDPMRVLRGGADSTG